jgi:serine phosphatase RsbU (regulator of sigma subunit)/tetratricopeptide (TPR) repeat protein
MPSRALVLSIIFAFAFPSSAQNPHLDSLLRVFSSQKDDTSKANTLNELTRTYFFEISDIHKTHECASKQLELSKKLDFKKGIGFAYLNLAIFYRSTGEFDTSLAYDMRSASILNKIGHTRGESSAYLNIGLDYYKQGNYPNALEYLFKGLKMKEALADKKGIASAYNNIANIYSTQGRYTDALQYLLKALTIREELNDKVGISMGYNNIGILFKEQGKSEEALDYYRKSLKINEELNDQTGIGNAYLNIGNIYLEKENYNEARTCYFKSLSSYKATDNKSGIALCYSGIGTLYLREKNMERSIRYLLKSFNLYQKIGDKKGVIEASGAVGNAYEEINDFTNAHYYYSLMLTLAQELNYKEAKRDAYANYASMYKKQKQFEQALHYTNLYTTIKDSILNKDNFKQISELNTRYETEKKEKEILLLTKDKQLNDKIIRQQQLVRWGLTGGLVLLFISIFSIYRRYRFKQRANIILENQKKEIQQKNMLITDSIDYAKTIQEAVLPTAPEIEKLFPQSFILNKPKAIVSGDFYWISKSKKHLICAVADCTGHGVPGAFMSLLGYNMLENVVKTISHIEPARILDSLNSELIKGLAREGDQLIKHGMDISLIAINTETHQLQFAGAHNSIYIVRNSELTELKADRKGIGFTDSNSFFTNQTFQLEKGDMIYLYTDGFPDQIGGPNRKKFYYQPFKELLINASKLEVKTQQKKLDETHEGWLGERKDQTDDILIMGINYC